MEDRRSELVSQTGMYTTTNIRDRQVPSADSLVLKLNTRNTSLVPMLL